MVDEGDTLRRLGALLGASGVALGAFGAHALKETLAKKSGAADNWKTAVTYQLFHAAAMLAIASLESQTGDVQKDKAVSTGYYYTGGKVMAAGTFLFSGSIYALSLDVGPKKLLGPTTPIGGLMMMAGWVMVGLS